VYLCAASNHTVARLIECRGDGCDFTLRQLTNSKITGNPFNREEYAHLRWQSDRYCRQIDYVSVVEIPENVVPAYVDINVTTKEAEFLDPGSICQGSYFLFTLFSDHFRLFHLKPQLQCCYGFEMSPV
jgi:hypothetical protein